MATGRDRRRTYRLVMAGAGAGSGGAVVTATVVGAAGMSVGEAFRAFAAFFRGGTDRHRKLPRTGRPGCCSTFRLTPHRPRAN